MDSDFSEATAYKLQADNAAITVAEVADEIDGDENSLKPVCHDYTLNASQERLVREAWGRRSGRIISLDIREGRPGPT